MNLEYGADVMDSNGKALGKVDYLVRNLRTSKVKIFEVYREGTEGNLVLSPSDVLEINEGTVMLKLSLEQIIKRRKTMAG